MSTKSWFIIFGALISAGLADFGTFASLPAWLQARDLEWLPRTYGPLALLVGKVAVIGAMALLVASLRRRRRYGVDCFAASTIVMVASSWAYGAWTNIANNPGWLIVPSSLDRSDWPSWLSV